MKMNNLNIIILLSLMFCKSCKTYGYSYQLTYSCILLSDAQLTPPGEAVCVGKQVVFVCQQTGSLLRWPVSNLPGGSSNDLVKSASTSIGTVMTFNNDPFGFEIRTLPSSSSSSTGCELRVTAVRQLNDATVECTGISGSFMSTIQIASVGEFSHSFSNMIIYLAIDKL